MFFNKTACYEWGVAKIWISIRLFSKQFYSPNIAQYWNSSAFNIDIHTPTVISTTSVIHLHSYKFRKLVALKFKMFYRYNNLEK